MENIGLGLKTLRTRHGLSQRRLAALSGVSNATISLIEHGRTDPSMGLLKRVLDAMGVSFAEFFASRGSVKEKFFYSVDELSEIGAGLISYRQVGSDLLGAKLQILHGRRVGSLPARPVDHRPDADAAPVARGLGCGRGGIQPRPLRPGPPRRPAPN